VGRTWERIPPLIVFRQVDVRDWAKTGGTSGQGVTKLSNLWGEKRDVVGCRLCRQSRFFRILGVENFHWGTKETHRMDLSIKGGF